METKRCSHCGEEKPLTEFNKRKLSKDGLEYYCRDCDKKNHNNYYSKHKDIISEKGKIYYKNNTEKIKERTSLYRINHKEEYNEYHKQYHKFYKINKSEQLKKSRKKYKETHKNKSLEYDRRDVAECKNHYIKKSLIGMGFPKDKITDELIEAQRLIIKIKRLTNQKQN